MKLDEDPTSDDGPSRPGVGLRRAVVITISVLLLVFTPLFLLILWALASPDGDTFGRRDSLPSRPVLSRSTIRLTIERHDWSRFVQAVDKFALEHELVDDHPANTELRQSYFSYTGGEADLTFNRKATAADAPTIEIEVTILEIAPGGGERLKVAFEKEVIRAGRFGN